MEPRSIEAIEADIAATRERPGSSMSSDRDTLAWRRGVALASRAFALAMAAPLVVYAAYRLGVENERAYPGDRSISWAAVLRSGEGTYLLGLVALCIASQAICHWSVETGKRIGGGGHE